MTLGRPRPLGRARLWVWLTSILAFTLSANAGAAPRRLVVATTCDLHGALGVAPAGASAAAAAGGGAIALSGYVRALARDFPGRLLYLDAGDLFVGTLASRASSGAAVVEALNLMGLDAAALGNHEFDFGREVLAARMRQARFPFLAANVDRAAAGGTPERWPAVAPSTLVDRGGVRVGVVGIASPWTRESTVPGVAQDLTFVAPAPRVVAEAALLRRRGAEVVVLLAHVGTACARFEDPADLAAGCPAPARGELFALVEAMPRGTVDIAIGGHTHGLAAHWLGDTAILQAGTRGEFLVWMEAAVGAGGGLLREGSTLHPPQAVCLRTWADGRCHGAPPPGGGAVAPARFRGRPVAPDPRVVEAMRPHLAEVARQEAAPTGIRLPAAMDPEALCRAAADGMRRRTGADLAFQNVGGFRMALPAGDLRQGALFAAMPFDNALVVVTMTPAQAADLWRSAHSVGTHLGPPMCQSGPAPDDLPGPTLRVATNAFVAGGGEGTGAVFAALPAGAVVPAQGGVAEALALELARRFPAAPLPRADAAD